MEAPAGSGKTGLLIQRLLKLLGEAELSSPADILAITFTRKAAQELRTRVLEQLSNAAAGDPLAENAGTFERDTRRLAEKVLSRDRLLGWHLLQTPQQLNIRTIDSFCGDLARSMPLLSGGMGRRQPIEDAFSLYKEAAGRTIRELGGESPVLNRALHTLLLHRDGRVGDCIELIAGMLAAREQWGELVPLSAPELSEDHLDGTVRRHLDRTLEIVVSHGLQRAVDTIPGDWLARISGLAARLSLEPGYNGQRSPVALFSGHSFAPGSSAEEIDYWLALAGLVLTSDSIPRASFSKNLLKFELPAGAKPELKQLTEELRDFPDRPGALAALCAVRDLPPTRMPDDQWEILKAAFRVLRRALAELEVLFAERGVCDFTALALTARQLMYAPGDTEVASVPGIRLQHLLVDEMQDTSVGQYSLFERLTRFWDGGSQTVFLVGDPKQSIYAFRQARVERFLRTQQSEKLGEVPLGALRLTANFRSQGELVQQFNHTFAAVFPAPEQLATAENMSLQAVEVPFIEAVPTRSPGTSPALHWHPTFRQSTQQTTSFAGSDGENADATSEEDEEAQSIRLTIERFIARWHAERRAGTESVRPPRIAVLGRNRSHLAPIIAEFQRPRNGAGPLAFRAVEIEVLSERPEVLDLLALTRALLHPGDRVAWMAVLRSPVCGLSLADLLRLAGEGAGAETTASVPHLVQTRRHLLSETGRFLLDRVWPVLAQAQGNLGRSSLATDVERTWRSLGADVFLNADSLTNARRFFRLLSQLDEGSEPLNLQLLEQRVKKLYAESAQAGAVVELMTIHKSKGLEWDLVLVPSLDRQTGNGEGELLRWLELDQTEEGASALILAPISSKGEQGSKLWRWLLRLQTEREVAEAKRLFYVACTRAREELHLYATAKLTRTGELATPAARSLLSAAWMAARPVFEQKLNVQKQAPRLEQEVSPGQAASLIFWPAPVHPVPEFPAEARLEEPLALAAAAEPEQTPAAIRRPTLPEFERLPTSFDPLARFRRETGPQLWYPPASGLKHAAPFARPEGSLAARAFGNVVHRFLELAARQLREGQTPHSLAAELPQWFPRLLAAFRSEGLLPSVCQHEAARALRALQATLLDPVGQWLLQPHTASWSERSLQLGAVPQQAGPVTLRADRVFLSGPEPCSSPLSTHLWIVDFKTSDKGGRDEEIFFAAERRQYSEQLEGYARACRALGETERPIVVALYYPLLTHLTYWPFAQQHASE